MCVRVLSVLVCHYVFVVRVCILYMCILFVFALLLSCVGHYVCCLIGMEQIILRERKAKVASVLLFTDGLANRGITGFNEIIKAMKDPIGSLARPGVLDNARNPMRPLVS